MSNGVAPQKSNRRDFLSDVRLWHKADISVQCPLLGATSKAPAKGGAGFAGWSQEELATASDVSLPTIKRLEAAEGWLAGRQTTSHKIRAALELAGIEFLNENGGGPGVRLRKRQRLKKPK